MWDPARDSEESYYKGWHDSPEIARLMTLIQHRTENDRVWPVFRDDVRRALGRKFLVLNGTPPMFLIPSLQIVIGWKDAEHDLAIVVRLSMLARFHGYYERIRTRDQTLRKKGTPERPHESRFLEERLAPGPETERVAGRVLAILSGHYPAYHELPRGWARSSCRA